MEIKNLKRAAQRIKKAVKNKEKIILYGDADLDGAASVIILKEAVKSLGGEISVVYFPDREKEGYGINEKALKFLKNQTPALFVAFDCGIGNFEEIKLAKKLGFEVIIIEHHEILDKLPEASIIVDPKQKGDKYPFKSLATAGIAYKLALLILGRKISSNLEQSFLELVALATIADMMPQELENKIFIEKGLQSLENSWRPGIQAFQKIDSVKNYQTSLPLAQKIISALNTPAMENHLSCAYLLLTADSSRKAEKLAQELLEKSLQRRMRVKEIAEEIGEMILKKPSEAIIFEGNPSWPLILTGSVASRFCNQLKKPVFLFKIQRFESVGAVRTPKGVNGVEAMKSCSRHLLTYGGHPPAAGFRIKNKNLEKFKECLIKYFSIQRGSA